MSKSLGNGIDPFDLIDQYGTDALRYFLTTSGALGLDFRFDEGKIEAAWNYLNKIWNISRYVLMNLGSDFKLTRIEPEKLNLASKSILTRLNTLIENVDYNFDKYELGEAARAIYNFVWTDFASWYVEISKVDLTDQDPVNCQMTKNVLVYTLKSILKLLHPFCPFITEELYQALPHQHESITVSNWPTVKEEYQFSEAKLAIDDLIELITAVRNERAKANRAPSIPISITITCKDQESLDMLTAAVPYIKRFTNPKELKFQLGSPAIENHVVVVLSCATLSIPTSDLVDQKEAMAKLILRKEKLASELERSKKMLSNPGFIGKAPEAKIAAEKAKLADYEAQYQEVCEALEQLQK